MPGRPGGYPPGLPQVRTRPIKAYGASVTQGLAPLRNQRQACHLWRMTSAAQQTFPPAAVPRVCVNTVGELKSLPRFRPVKRHARRRLPYRGSLGPRFPTYRLRHLSAPMPSVLCSATTAQSPSQVASLVTRFPVPCLHSFFVSRLSRLADWVEATRRRQGFCCAGAPDSSGYPVKETVGSPKFPCYPYEYMPRSSGRNTARTTLGREFPTCTLSVCAAGS